MSQYDHLGSDYDLSEIVFGNQYDGRTGNPVVSPGTSTKSVYDSDFSARNFMDSARFFRHGSRQGNQGMMSREERYQGLPYPPDTGENIQLPPIEKSQKPSPSADSGFKSFYADSVLKSKKPDYMDQSFDNASPRYINGTPVARLKDADPTKVFEIIAMESYNASKDPYYLHPTHSRYAIATLEYLKDGILFVILMYVILGLILSCAWFFFTRIDLVFKEIQNQSFYQAFYAINFLIAIVVGNRFHHAFNSTKEASEKYLQLLSNIEWLSLTASTMLKHSLKQKGFSREMIEEIVKTKAVLLALAYHSYSCMTERGFKMDRTYIRYRINRGEALLKSRVKDPSVSMDEIRNYGSPAKIFEHYDLLMKIASNTIRLSDPIDFSDNDDMPTTITKRKSIFYQPYYKLTGTPPDPSITRCYIYDTSSDQIIVAPLDVSVRSYGDIETLGPDFNGYAGPIKRKAELIEKMKIAAKNLSNHFSDDELEILETRLRQNSIADDTNNYNPATNVTPGFGALPSIEEKNLKNRFYVTSLALQYMTSKVPSALSKEAQRTALHSRVHEVYTQINEAAIEQRHLQPEVFEKIYGVVIYVYLFVVVPLQVFSATNGYWALPIIWAIFLIYIIPTVMADWIGDPFQDNKENLHPPHREYREDLCASIESAFQFVNDVVDPEEQNNQ